MVAKFKACFENVNIVGYTVSFLAFQRPDF